MDKVIDLLLKAWEKAGSPLWESLVFWRAAALIIISALGLAVYYRKKILERLASPEIHRHDRQLFRTADKIMPEQFAKDVLMWIGANADVAGDDSDRLRDFCNFFELEQNQFLTRPLRKSVLEAVNVLRHLNAFMAQHFFVEYINKMRRYQLYPELKHSSDPDKRAIYQQRFDELGEIIDGALLVCRSYRRDVKRILRE